MRSASRMVGINHFVFENQEDLLNESIPLDISVKDDIKMENEEVEIKDQLMVDISNFVFENQEELLNESVPLNISVKDEIKLGNEEAKIKDQLIIEEVPELNVLKGHELTHSGETLFVGGVCEK